MFEKNTVSIYLLKGDEILLLYRDKKENDINHNKYIGVGGHIELGESPDEAITREVKEETNYDLLDKTLRGVITFYFDEFIEHMYLYTSSCFIGEEIECNEGTLRWVKVKEMKNLPMWEGDKYFLEIIFNENTYFEIEEHYKGDKLISYKRII